MTDAPKRKVCVVLVDRANYGRMKPVMQAIRARKSLALQVLATGTMVLERFDQPVQVVREDGFDVDSEIHIELEGSTPTTMAKSKNGTNTKTSRMVVNPDKAMDRSASVAAIQGKIMAPAMQLIVPK